MIRSARAALASAAALALALGLWPGVATAPQAVPALPASAATYSVLGATEIDLEGARIGAVLRAGRNGHFYVKGRINGRSVPFLVDTGASYVTLNYNDARKAGIRLSRKDFKHQVSTANGRAWVAAVRIPVLEVRSIRVREVTALVAQRGAMDGINLLGNSFLSKLRTFKVMNGRLIMR